MTNILRDDQLGGASEDQLRAHYSEIADEYVERVRQTEPPARDAETTVRSFAKFAGCKPGNITYVPAAEAAVPTHLFQPLSPQELREVSSWSVGSFQ